MGFMIPRQERFAKHVDFEYTMAIFSKTLGHVWQLREYGVHLHVLEQVEKWQLWGMRLANNGTRLYATRPMVDTMGRENV